MGVSQLLGARAQAAPPSLRLWSYPGQTDIIIMKIKCNSVWTISINWKTDWLSVLKQTEVKPRLGKLKCLHLQMGREKMPEARQYLWAWLPCNQLMTNITSISLNFKQLQFHLWY